MLVAYNTFYQIMLVRKSIFSFEHHFSTATFLRKLKAEKLVIRTIYWMYLIKISILLWFIPKKSLSLQLV